MEDRYPSAMPECLQLTISAYFLGPWALHLICYSERVRFRFLSLGSLVSIGWESSAGGSRRSTKAMPFLSPRALQRSRPSSIAVVLFVHSEDSSAASRVAMVERVNQAVKRSSDWAPPKVLSRPWHTRMRRLGRGVNQVQSHPSAFAAAKARVCFSPWCKLHASGSLPTTALICLHSSSVSTS